MIGMTKASVSVVLLMCLHISLATVSAQGLDETRALAENGDAEAQHFLGIGYAEGLGLLSKDEIEAVKWFRKAAEQNYPSAQCSLGTMYFEGKGVPKDLVQAHAWNNVAGANGCEPSRIRLPTIERAMSSQQLAEATKLAEVIFARLKGIKPKRIKQRQRE
jgi:TPR repeat protein